MTARDEDSPDLGDGRFTDDEIDELRAKVATAQRARSRGRLLGTIGIVLAAAGMLTAFFGWRVLPGEAVVSVSAAGLGAGVVGALLVRAFVGTWRTDDQLLDIRENLLATAETLSAAERPATGSSEGETDSV